MNGIYKLGIVIGIIVIYCLVTFCIATIATINQNDVGITFAVAWVIGVLFFLGLSVIYLDERGMWNLPVKNETAIETTIEGDE